MNLDSLREHIKTLPLTPGVYFIEDGKGQPIYIGKARELRKRLASHFSPGAQKDYKEKLIQKEARGVRVVETISEAEALILEASSVKEHTPKYNRELRDDKSFPYLKITIGEKFPRLLITRRRESDGSIYFGPYTNVTLLRQAVAVFRRVFPMRTCRSMPDEVCLMFHIGQCGGPCVNKIGESQYKEMVKELLLILDGKKEALLKYLEDNMKQASLDRRYEKAKLFRDQIQALTGVCVGSSPLNRAQALDRMKETFRLSRYPSTIEAFDISNFAGKNPVGSMVLFRNGQPKRREYRRFKIRTIKGVDDYGMMREIVRRRYERLLSERRPLPDLILIDGGRAHLAVAAEELSKLNLDDVDILSIAKQHERIFSKTKITPYVLASTSPVLQLIRHVRDEAHRYAITFYRSMHKKSMRFSELDTIPGVGVKRRRILSRYFKNLSEIRSATHNKLCSVPGIDKRTAANIEQYLKKS